jgi:uncharacterized protein (DUF1800 family)
MCSIGRTGLDATLRLMTTHPQWDLTAAAHLLRRAAFGGSAEEVDIAVRRGCQATVDGLLKPGIAEKPRSGVLNLATLNGIIEWWVERMLRSPSPLQERMTFFWHAHFATSIATVRHPQLMLRQNELFRSHATGNFRVLTEAVARDPAMLLWLDNYLNRKEHPNENFGRELLELFVLGLGHYSESDVAAAARAFTGWTLTDESASAQFRFASEMHDSGTKRFLGHVAAADGQDIVRIACRERAHARFLARKLFVYFAHDHPPDAVIDHLAETYLRHDCEVRPLLSEILTSPEMYSPAARWSRVKSPIDHAMIACHQLGIDADPAVVADVLNRQGLMLFSPPDVGGWKGGMSWINSWSMLIRFQFAVSASEAFDPARLTGERKFATAGELVSFYLHLLGPIEIGPALRERLVRRVAPRGGMPSGAGLVQAQRGLVRLILSMPEWQRN